MEKHCKSKSPRCNHCSGDHHFDACTKSDKPVCMYCKGNHTSSDKSCKEYIRQTKIKNIMSNESISFIDAAKKIQNSYVEVSNRFVSLSTESEFPQLPMNRSNPQVRPTRTYKRPLLTLQPQPHISSRSSHTKPHPSINSQNQYYNHLSSQPLTPITSNPHTNFRSPHISPDTDNIVDNINDIFLSIINLIPQSQLTSSLTESCSALKEKLLHTLQDKDNGFKNPPVERTFSRE